MRSSAQSVRRGFSLLDALVVLIVVTVALGMGLIYGLYQQSTARGCGGPVSCRTRVNQIPKGLALYANDFGGSFPIPTNLSPETAAISAQSGNSSANLFSYMIFNTYYSPETAVCPQDANPNIIAKLDYRYGLATDANWREGWAWDPTFSADLTAPGANLSYATLALTGGRVAMHWRLTIDPSIAVVADRGPRGGAWDAASRTLRHEGSGKAWIGHVAFSDGSVQRLTWRDDDPQPFLLSGDNIFREDDRNARSDLWLGVFGATNESAAAPFWD